MARTFPIIVAFGFLILSGLVHGLWTNRWGNPEPLERALARVDGVPMRFGPWLGSPQSADAEAFERAGAQAYWVRQYVLERERRSLQVILMCGRAGRMAVHTPEVCYGGTGYELHDGAPPRIISTGAGRDTFWAARFAKAADESGDLRLAWAWNAGGTWQAPTNPRWTFRGVPFLYKLYVIQQDGPVAGRSPAASDDGALDDFLQHALPALKSSLFPEHADPS